MNNDEKFDIQFEADQCFELLLAGLQLLQARIEEIENRINKIEGGE